MIRTRAIMLLIVGSLCLAACRNNSIIPENDMVRVLTKVYINEGLLLDIDRSKNNIDNMLFYEPILEQYGYTRKQFDSSVLYYSHHPEILDRIYDQVISDLTQIETRISDEIEHQAEANSQLWPMANNLTLQQADSMGNPQLQFEVPTARMGIYTLTFDFQRFANDSTVSPRFDAALYTTDGQPFSQREYTYTADDTAKSMTFVFEHTDSSINVLRGHLYQHTSPNSTSTHRHAKFSNITLKYEPMSKSRMASLKRHSKRTQATPKDKSFKLRKKQDLQRSTDRPAQEAIR